MYPYSGSLPSIENQLDLYLKIDNGYCWNKKFSPENEKNDKKNAAYLSKFVFADDLSLKRFVNPMIKESDIQI